MTLCFQQHVGLDRRQANDFQTFVIPTGDQDPMPFGKGKGQSCFSRMWYLLSHGLRLINRRRCILTGSGTRHGYIARWQGGHRGKLPHDRQFDILEQGQATFTVFLRSTPVGVERVGVVRSPDGWVVRVSGQLRPPFSMDNRRSEVEYD